jgi:hypothetical protein
MNMSARLSFKRTVYQTVREERLLPIWDELSHPRKESS